MTDIAANIRLLRSKIAPSVKIVAVSKTKPVTDILVAYNAGQRIFGENRVQEILAKKDLLPPDISWHMIGHLQTNKVKNLVSFVALIHSIDSFRLLKSVDNEALKAGKIVNCLLQFHIATEETKFGFDEQEAIEMLESDDFKELKNVRICGVMGMATLTDNMEEAGREFRNLHSIFDKLKREYFSGSPDFSEISMGMSGDFETAIKEGSTMIRVGSLIFGERNSR